MRRLWTAFARFRACTVQGDPAARCPALTMFASKSFRISARLLAPLLHRLSVLPAGTPILPLCRAVNDPSLSASRRKRRRYAGPSANRPAGGQTTSACRAVCIVCLFSRQARLFCQEMQLSAQARCQWLVRGEALNPLQVVSRHNVTRAT
jgi:hypothetical protein